MEKIIVPIDFSEHSEHALKAAAALARKNKTEIIVLNMLEMSDIMLTATGGDQKEKALFFHKLAEQELKLFLKKDYLKHIKITPIIKQFKVFTEVNEVALKHHADLVVMGSHGVTGVKELVIGSNTERVVRSSNIPVLVVKNELASVDFKNVVFACDFSKETIKAYINVLKMFNDAKITIVYVNLPNDRFRSSDEIEQSAKDFFMTADGHLKQMQNFHCISDYTPESGILNFSKKIGADIIAIPTHGRKGIAHFLEGSIGEDIANHASLPVMTFKV
ncbi:universal stress protein UspA [Yeosuana aromativorans]|uniref:Universal stress protein UspA n=1 Tax=Yeosuana aromativorans TaxID=288019 RepID=A0A8J3BQC1_9FLAO|nr:universal stress protein [Yeosuana aromativorans]GGK20176.1 universal stress protein UspA [Yeosuana aromativorans]